VVTSRFERLIMWYKYPHIFQVAPGLTRYSAGDTLDAELKVSFAKIAIFIIFLVQGEARCDAIYYAVSKKSRYCAFEAIKRV